MYNNVLYRCMPWNPAIMKCNAMKLPMYASKTVMWPSQTAAPTTWCASHMNNTRNSDSSDITCQHNGWGSIRCLLRTRVARESTNCLRDGLLFAPQCKWIDPNASSSASSWLGFQVPSYMNIFSSFSLLLAGRTAPTIFSHSVCVEQGVSTFILLVQEGPAFYLLTKFLQCSYSHSYHYVGNAVLLAMGQCSEWHHWHCWRSWNSLANIAVDRELLPMYPARNIRTWYKLPSGLSVL